MSASVAYFVALAKATGFASPASERRDSSPTSTAASSELEQQVNRDTVSPIKHTTERLNEDTLRKPLSTMKLYKVTGNKISKGKGPNRKQKRKSVWDFSRLSSFFSKEQDEEKEEQSIDDLEGDTMVDCDNPMPTTEDDNDRTMVEEDDGFKPEKGSKKQKKIQPIQKEHNNRYLDYNDPRLMDWSRDEIWLFNKFARRGAEPLLPQSWTLDFPTFPDILFTNDPDRVFMNKHHGSEYNRKRLPFPYDPHI